METIKEGMEVKYIGKTNDYTFKDDLSQNSIGIVKNVFEVDGKEIFQVEFKNGILASIDLKDLEKLK
jgi:hypothetical protein